MKRSLLTTGLVTALTLTAIGGAAFAHQRGGDGPGRPSFSEFDADGDGQITAAELVAHRTARFTEADANGDGVLSAEELMAHVQSDRAERAARRAERMVERLDSNDDGVLSIDEITARFDGSRMIERLDTDGDGAVSEAEFAEMGEGRGVGKRHGKGHGQGQGHGDGHRN